MNREEWQSLFNKYIPDSVNIQIHHNPDTTISINNSDFPNDADALNSGRIIVSEADVRDRIFKGGVVPEIRFEVWKFLLNVYPWDSTWIQRQHIRAENVKIYQQLKERCRYLQENLEMIEKEKRKGTKLDKETTKFLDGYFRIERDVIRTDRTHPFYAPPDNLAVNTAIATATTSSPSASNHPTSSNLPSSLSLSADLQQCIRNLRKLENILMAYSIWPDNPNSYVQGMADLASPLLIAMNGDEVDAFFCLAKLMEMMVS